MCIYTTYLSFYPFSQVWNALMSNCFQDSLLHGLATCLGAVGFGLSRHVVIFDAHTIARPHVKAKRKKPKVSKQPQPAQPFGSRLLVQPLLRLLFLFSCREKATAHHERLFTYYLRGNHPLLAVTAGTGSSDCSQYSLDAWYACHLPLRLWGD